MVEAAPFASSVLGAWFSDRLPELAAEVDNVRAAVDWSLGEAANRAGGNAFGVQMGLGNVGACDAYSGAPERAIGALREAVAGPERIGTGDAAGHFLKNMAFAFAAGRRTR